MRRFFVHKSPLDPIVGGLEGRKTWLGRGEFTPTNSGVRWASRMPVHARLIAQHLFFTSLKSAMGGAAGVFFLSFFLFPQTALALEGFLLVL